MSVAAIVAEIERKALRPPKRFRRERICQYVGSFCVFCEEVLPCVQKGIYQDCDSCIERDCPCMEEAVDEDAEDYSERAARIDERAAAYQEWKEQLNAANALTAERKRKYRRPWDNSRAYSQGRTCMDPGCKRAITNQNASGFCKRCSALRRKA